jgi:hypothetical protein
MDTSENLFDAFLEDNDISSSQQIKNDKLIGKKQMNIKDNSFTKKNLKKQKI